MDNREKVNVERAKQEDVILHRVLIWIVGAVILEALLLLLNRFYLNYTVAEIGIAQGISISMTILAVAFPLCFLLCVVWAWMGRQNKKNGLQLALSAVFGVLAVCAVIIWASPSTGVKILYVMVPVMAVLVMVYYLYQREFFAVTAICAGGIFSLWVVQRLGVRDVRVYAGLTVAAILLLAVAIGSRLLQSKGGVLRISGKPIRVLPKNANYAMLYATCCIVALVLAAATLLLGVLSFSVFYGVLVAWLLIMAVYYTVRLM